MDTTAALTAILQLAHITGIWRCMPRITMQPLTTMVGTLATEATQATTGRETATSIAPRPTTTLTARQITTSTGLEMPTPPDPEATALTIVQRTMQRGQHRTEILTARHRRQHGPAHRAAQLRSPDRKHTLRRRPIPAEEDTPAHMGNKPINLA